MMFYYPHNHLVKELQNVKVDDYVVFERDQTLVVHCQRADSTQRIERYPSDSRLFDLPPEDDLSLIEFIVTTDNEGMVTFPWYRIKTELTVVLL
jgi:hypothetical protein